MFSGMCAFHDKTPICSVVSILRILHHTPITVDSCLQESKYWLIQAPHVVECYTHIAVHLV